MAAKTLPAAPALNAAEKLIAQFSPKWGFRRLQHKTALALAGGYSGASRSRASLRNWTPGASSADDDSAWDMPALRARSRDLVRNAPLASGAINTMVTNVVGTGLSMQSRIDGAYLGMSEEQADAWQDHAEREFRLWCESTDCDVTRTQDFYGLQSLAFRAALESGDVFALTPSVERKSSPYTLAVQLIESDRVCNKGSGGDTANQVAGIVLDEYGAPTAYQICNRHPLSLRGAAKTEWTTVPAFGTNTGRRNVLHLFDRKRPGQTRGIPVLAPVIEPLKQLERYTEAELQAAVISGSFAVFLRMDPEAFNDLFTDDQRSSYVNGASGWDGSVDSSTLDGPGKAINLLPGEEPVPVNPGRPNSEFDPFVQAIVRQIGVALELPFEVLIKHFTASYSAARAALLDAWRFFRGRRDWLASRFCQPIYELWLEEAIATGRIYAPGYFADPAIRKAYSGAVWVGDGPGAIDPLKEINAAKERVALGVSTRAAESILHDGGDWKIKHRQLAKEQKAREADGLSVEIASASDAALNAPTT
jgi:lambda family phage portal protein